MKKETFTRLYEEALATAEKERTFFDEAEIVLVPVVLCKSKGKVGTITGVETKIIFEYENKE